MSYFKREAKVIVGIFVGLAVLGLAVTLIASLGFHILGHSPDSSPDRRTDITSDIRID
jgi:hypothetical protein